MWGRVPLSSLGFLRHVLLLTPPYHLGLGVRVQGLGFRVQGLGFRFEGLGFRV